MKDNIINQVLREPEKVHIQIDIIFCRATSPPGLLVSDKDAAVGKTM
jgi:hypothetical protein